MAEVHFHRVSDNVLSAESGLGLGNMDPRFSEVSEVARNRAKLISELGIVPESTYVMVPKASTLFADVDDPFTLGEATPSLPERAVLVDALITRRAGIGLMLNPADCIPLVLHDPKTKLLSLVHLGWKGAEGRLHKKVLDYSIGSFGTDPNDIQAYLGPSISSKNYTTQALSDAQANDDEWSPFIAETDDGFHVDVPGFVIATLQKYGIGRSNIQKSQKDTGARSGEYYSYTRHKNEGVPNGRNGFAVVRMPAVSPR